MPGDNGISINGKISESNVNFFIDTGSAMTFLLKDIFEVINKDSSFKLVVPFQIELADGQELEVLGQFTCMLGIGKNLLTHTLIVADMKSDGILGVDFIMKHDHKIDISRSEMILDGQKILTNVDGDIEVQCQLVATISDVGLGPYEQATVQAMASKRGKLAQNMMIEGSTLLMERDSILVARSLVDATQNTVSVRVFNVSDEEVLLRKGTTVAIGYPGEGRANKKYRSGRPLTGPLSEKF